MRDRTRITGARVTSGIDFALTAVADLAGPDQAAALREKIAPVIARRRTATDRAAAWLGVDQRL